MKIPKARYDAYSANLQHQQEQCAAELSRFIANLDTDDIAEIREAVTEYAQVLVDVYGTNAATLAADLIEDTSDIDALLDNRTHDEQVEATTRYAARHLVDGDIAAFDDAMQTAVKRYVRQQAAWTMTDNAKRGYGLRFARVPTSPVPCGFCIMLASRGFVYYTAESAGEFCAYHNHCSCDVIASTDGVEGYSEQPYLELYDEATRMEGSHTSRGALDAKGIARNIDILTGTTSEDQTT